LLKCLQEELLYFRSLVKHHLSERLNLFELGVFAAENLSCIQDLLALLLNNRLVLETNHFLFLFEIAHDLLERLLENRNLRFVLLNFLVLSVLAAHILLLSALVDVNVALQLGVHILKLRNFLLVVVDACALGNGLLV